MVNYSRISFRNWMILMTWEADRGVDFFRMVGGMRLPNWRGFNGQSSCGLPFRVLGNSSEMLRNASWTIYAKSVFLKRFNGLFVQYMWQDCLISKASEVCLLSLKVSIVEVDKDITVIQSNLRKLKLSLPNLSMIKEKKKYFIYF